MKFKYSSQTVDQSDINAVKKVLKSEYLTQGPKVEEFEKKISKYTKSKFCLAFNSASSALLAACKSLKLKKKDCIWTSPNTFVATANSIILSGYQIDFVDIDLNTHNISLSKLEEKLKEAKKRKKLPKALIVVHIAGLPIDPLKLKNYQISINLKLLKMPPIL